MPGSTQEEKNEILNNILSKGSKSDYEWSILQHDLLVTINDDTIDKIINCEECKKMYSHLLDFKEPPSKALDSSQTSELIKKIFKKYS